MHQNLAVSLQQFCYGKISFIVLLVQNPFYSKSAVETTSILSNDGCRRCRGSVFDAEKMSMRSGDYHRMCFTCLACRRALDYLLAVDGPGAQLFFKKNNFCFSSFFCFTIHVAKVLFCTGNNQRQITSCIFSSLGLDIAKVFIFGQLQLVPRSLFLSEHRFFTDEKLP